MQRAGVDELTTWTYPSCAVVSVYDGDTIRVDIDFGQEIWVRNRAIRMAGIAARELHDPGGFQARDFLRSLLPPGTPVRIISTGWDKYAGRIDGLVVRLTPQGDPDLNVNDVMVEQGYAARWNGEGPQPKPPWPIPAGSRLSGASVNKEWH